MAEETVDGDESAAVKPRKAKIVFSPELSQEVRDQLLEHKKMLVPASAPTPQKLVQMRQSPVGSVFSLLFFAGIQYWFWRLLRWAFYGVFPDGLAYVLTIMAGVLGVLIFAGTAKGMAVESKERAAVREHHGKYLLPTDWDDEATILMLRAQAAVKAVKKSEVNKRGLLDAVKNDVVLPEQLWDIGRVLQQQSALRKRQAEITKGLESKELDAVLGPQRQALRISATAMEEKVAKLEQYADQVREADAVLRTETVLTDAIQDSDRYVELLASTEAAADGALIEELSRETAEVRSTLSRSLAAALEAGQALALPSRPEPPAAGQVDG